MDGYSFCFCYAAVSRVRLDCAKTGELYIGNNDKAESIVILGFQLLTKTNFSKNLKGYGVVDYSVHNSRVLLILLT